MKAYPLDEQLAAIARAKVDPMIVFGCDHVIQIRRPDDSVIGYAHVDNRVISVPVTEAHRYVKETAELIAKAEQPHILAGYTLHVVLFVEALDEAEQRVSELAAW